MTLDLTGLSPETFLPKFTEAMDEAGIGVGITGLDDDHQVVWGDSSSSQGEVIPLVDIPRLGISAASLPRGFEDRAVSLREGLKWLGSCLPQLAQCAAGKSLVPVAAEVREVREMARKGKPLPRVDGGLFEGDFIKRGLLDALCSLILGERGDAALSFLFAADLCYNYAVSGMHFRDDGLDKLLAMPVAAVLAEVGALAAVSGGVRQRGHRFAAGCWNQTFLRIPTPSPFHGRGFLNAVHSKDPGQMAELLGRAIERKLIPDTIDNHLRRIWYLARDGQAARDCARELKGVFASQLRDGTTDRNRFEPLRELAARLSEI